ncbi:uncharacterized protein [Coffea arabica]|uniref:Reverse transcriptase zinc-binding domain-containing protein n=1 Tax=Coffea arabica TaxID=13443 RepID=A0ABM4W8V0_COFAR
MPTSAKPQHCIVNKVEELIQNYRWKRPFLFKLFKKEEAKRIMRIPINLADKEDRHFWTHNGNRKYTVASAYKELVKNDQQREGQQEGTSLRDNKPWKILWNLNLKHKIKMFLWKCLSTALPVNEIIYSRIKTGSPICNCCGEGIETVEHLFFQCRIAKEKWHLAQLHWDGIEDQREEFKKWWSSLTEAKCSSEGMEHITLIANILWQTWKARNDRMFNNVQQHPLKIVQKAQNEWMEYKEAKDQERRMSMLETPRAGEPQIQRKESADTIYLTIAVQQRMGGWDMGIRTVADDDNKQILMVTNSGTKQWLLN